MHVGQLTISDGEIKLILYDESLAIIENETFPDLFAANFFLQTMAKKLKFSTCLFVIHDTKKNAVKLSLAQDENSVFLS